MELLIQYVQNLLQAHYISVMQVGSKIAEEDLSKIDNGLRQNILNIKSVKNFIEFLFKNSLPNTIYFYTDIFQCNYTVIHLPKKESTEFLVCGPILFEPMEQNRFDAMFTGLILPEEIRMPLWEYYNKLPYFTSHTVYENIFTVLADFLFGKNNYQIVYHTSDKSEEWYLNYGHYLRVPDKPLHGVQMIEERYELENMLIAAVTSGNENKATEIAIKMQSIFIPKRMVNELRDNKDYTITLNTLLRKAVERAGVHPIYIDSHSNQTVQLIEQLTSSEACRVFQRKMVREYCRLVKGYNLKNYSTLIQKVITYVDTDLRADLSLKSMAELLSVNASYLSALFKKEMGIPLTEYVNRKRIELAQKMLINTDSPIKFIALQCGISDVHYFSRLFKNITGITPRVYRETACYNDKQQVRKTFYNGISSETFD